MIAKSLQLDDWRLLRQTRLRALAESPESFGADWAEEAAWPPERWRALLDTEAWGVLVDEAVICGLANVKPAVDAPDADCWIRGWWIAPEYRGSGLSKLLLAWVDDVCRQRDWRVQGLGVWCENTPARRAFETLEFTQSGPEQRSSAWSNRCYVRMVRLTPRAPGENPDARG